MRQSKRKSDRLKEPEKKAPKKLTTNFLIGVEKDEIALEECCDGVITFSTSTRDFYGRYHKKRSHHTPRSSSINALREKMSEFEQLRAQSTKCAGLRVVFEARPFNKSGSQDWDQDERWFEGLLVERVKRENWNPKFPQYHLTVEVPGQKHLFKKIQDDKVWIVKKFGYAKRLNKFEDTISKAARGRNAVLNALKNVKRAWPDEAEKALQVQEAA